MTQICFQHLWSDRAPGPRMYRAIGAAAGIHRSAGFVLADALVPRNPQAAAPSCLLSIADLTCACIACGGVAEENEGTWVAEATENLLDAWVELLAEDSFSPKAR